MVGLVIPLGLLVFGAVGLIWRVVLWIADGEEQV